MTHPRGLRAIVEIWFPLVGPIVAWAAHLLYISSATRLSCTRPGTEWGMHAVTAVLLAVTAAALALSWRLVRLGSDPADADDVGGRTVFLGRLGLLIGLFNAGLIVLEELYVLGFHSVRCGG